MGFFKYYESEFDFATQVVSPLEGRPIPISDVVTSVKLNHGKDFKVLCTESTEPSITKVSIKQLRDTWFDFFKMELHYCETV